MKCGLVVVDVMLMAHRIATHCSLGLWQQEGARGSVSGRGLFIEDTAPGDVVVLGPSLSKGGAGKMNSSLCSLPVTSVSITQTNTYGEFILNFVRNK